jgi:hypothetical protein
MSKEWMPPGGPDVYRKVKRSRLRLLIIILCLFSVSIVIAIAIWPKQVVRDTDIYLKAIEEKDYTYLMELYSATRDLAFDNTKSKAVREANLAEMHVIETHIKDKTLSIIEQIKKNNPLSAEDKNFLSLTGIVSTELIIEFLEEQGIEFVKDNITESDFAEQLNTLQQIDRFQSIVEPIIDSLEAIKLVQDDVKQAEQFASDKNWPMAYKLWNNLLLEEVPLAVGKYVEHRKNEVEQTVYDEYHQKISQYIENGRYYTAKKALTEVMVFFPDDPEFLSWYSQVSSATDSVQISWNRAIEHITMRPIIIDTARAFDNDIYAKQADSLMITADEFKAILSQLLANDYILVPGDSFISEKGKYTPILIPEGKKPLVLVIESFAYSPLRAESGTAECLELTDQNKIAGVLTDHITGSKEILEANSEIGLLNAFCREHPEFSYDGAKATLAITANRSIFGHVYSQTSLDNWNEERRQLNLAPLELSQDELMINRAKIKEIADELRIEGYTLASNTWGGINIPNSNLEAIVKDLKKWQDEVEPLIGKVRVLHYPNGDHVFSDSTRLSLLTDAGFCILSGYGDKAYMVSGKGHVHTDKVYIGGDELRKPQRQNLGRFFDSDTILSSSRP